MGNSLCRLALHNGASNDFTVEDILKLNSRDLAYYFGTSFVKSNDFLTMSQHLQHRCECFKRWSDNLEKFVSALKFEDERKKLEYVRSIIEPLGMTISPAV